MIYFWRAGFHRPAKLISDRFTKGVRPCLKSCQTFENIFHPENHSAICLRLHGENSNREWRFYLPGSLAFWLLHYYRSLRPWSLVSWIYRSQTAFWARPNLSGLITIYTCSRIDKQVLTQEPGSPGFQAVRQLPWALPSLSAWSHCRLVF